MENTSTYTDIVQKDFTKEDLEKAILILQESMKPKVTNLYSFMTLQKPKLINVACS